MQFTRLHYGVLLALGVATLAVGLVMWWWITAREPAAPTPVVEALGSGEAVYTYLDGTPVALEDFFGQPLVINTWASWSPLSRDELVALNEIAGSYDTSRIKFVALNRKETKEQASRFLATLPPLPHLTIIIDTDDYFYNRIGGYAMPETVIFSKQGEILTHERNPQTLDSFRAMIAPIVGEEDN